MGLTIHYKGALKKPDMVYPLIEEMSDMAQTMGWHYQVMDNDWDLPNTSSIDSEGSIQGHLPLKGILIKMHTKCESFSLVFDAKGRMTNMVTMALGEKEADWQHTKTQFAPVEIHLSMVKLMKYLSNRYFEQFEVFDEGKFWETDDAALLAQKHSFLGDMISKLGDALDNGLSEKPENPQNLVERIEAIITQMHKRSRK